MSTPRAIVIDDDSSYRQTIAGELLKIGFAKSDASGTDPDSSMVEHSSAPKEAMELPPGANLVILDNLYSKGGVIHSFWLELLGDLRRMHPGAVFLLVTNNDAQTCNAIELIKTDASAEATRAKRILESDPLIHFIPRPADQLFQDHINKVVDFGKSVLRQINDRRTLEAVLLQCALDAGKRIRYKGEFQAEENSDRERTLVSKFATLEELAKDTAVTSEKSSGTYRMDVFTEEAINDHFGDEVHSKDILICTEERGVHNRYHHRVLSPRFFVFSDPLDGSSPLREFLNSLMKQDPNWCSKSLAEVAKDDSAMAQWEKDHGSATMNSPMVSVVLAERHRVVANVLLNLFTEDVFLAVESGIYCGTVPGFALPDEEVLEDLKNGDPIRDQKWKRLAFQSWSDVIPSGEHKNSRVFLGTLQARKARNMKPSCYYEHSAACVSPVIPNTFSWEESFRLRHEQHDFTPGPGRVLFMLSKLEQLEKYESFRKIDTDGAAGQEGLNGEKYGCVLSCGEPLTEWIGWFAFLRHANGRASAFCLRKRTDTGTSCLHKEKPSDPACLLPPPVNSIFRDGGMDLLMLPAAYGRSMRRYHDTLVVVYDGDPDWADVLNPRTKHGDDATREDIYLRIPAF